ncbi:MAG: hypothetical protein SFW36_13175 [Leptolyngbyaceae cyanobacterium bins.59]|nr:hypothetical protein [Leptolyngbyaceae cyanobacterium bins.59]
MSKIALIHGNAVGIKFATRDRQTKYGSFKIFEELVDQGGANLFGWHYVNHEFNLLKTFSIFHFRHQYFTEKKYCNSPAAFQKLADFLELKQPEKLVCHSMGCYLLLNSINYQGISDSVRCIYLAQGDFRRGFRITHADTLNKLANGKLKIHNYYCPWDQMLFLSMLANFYLPGGMLGSEDPYIKDRLFPYLDWNFHHATIRSPRFLKDVLDS